MTVAQVPHLLTRGRIIQRMDGTREIRHLINEGAAAPGGVGDRYCLHQPACIAMLRILKDLRACPHLYEAAHILSRLIVAKEM